MSSGDPDEVGYVHPDHRGRGGELKMVRSSYHAARSVIVGSQESAAETEIAAVVDPEDRSIEQQITDGDRLPETPMPVALSPAPVNCEWACQVCDHRFGPCVPFAAACHGLRLVARRIGASDIPVTSAMIEAGRNRRLEILGARGDWWPAFSDEWFAAIYCAMREKEIAG